jgi:hypothetical protein
MALGINVEHSVPYVHTQNGLAEYLIKRVKLIARSLFQNCKFNILLGACGLARRRLDSNKIYCISYSIPVVVSTWESTKYLPSAKIQLRCIRTIFTTAVDINGPHKIRDICGV